MLRIKLQETVRSIEYGVYFAARSFRDLREWNEAGPDAISISTCLHNWNDYHSSHALHALFAHRRRSKVSIWRSVGWQDMKKLLGSVFNKNLYWPRSWIGRNEMQRSPGRCWRWTRFPSRRRMYNKLKNPSGVWLRLDGKVEAEQEDDERWRYSSIAPLTIVVSGPFVTCSSAS